MNRKTILILTGILILFFLALDCKKEEEIFLIASESWLSDVNQGTGAGWWTFEKRSDQTISADGEWLYYFYLWNAWWEVRCPFTKGVATVADTNVSFTASGNAYFKLDTNMKSTFALNVAGYARSGKAYGNFSIAFTAQSWPQQINGFWTADRTGGSGVTN